MKKGSVAWPKTWVSGLREVIRSIERGTSFRLWRSRRRWSQDLRLFFNHVLKKIVRRTALRYELGFDISKRKRGNWPHDRQWEVRPLGRPCFNNLEKKEKSESGLICLTGKIFDIQVWYWTYRKKASLNSFIHLGFNKIDHERRLVLFHWAYSMFDSKVWNSYLRVQTWLFFLCPCTSLRAEAFSTLFIQELEEHIRSFKTEIFSRTQVQLFHFKMELNLNFNFSLLSQLTDSGWL